MGGRDGGVCTHSQVWGKFQTRSQAIPRLWPAVRPVRVNNGQIFVHRDLKLSRNRQPDSPDTDSWFGRRNPLEDFRGKKPGFAHNIQHGGKHDTQRSAIIWRQPKTAAISRLTSKWNSSNFPQTQSQNLTFNSGGHSRNFACFRWRINRCIIRRLGRRGLPRLLHGGRDKNRLGPRGYLHAKPARLAGIN